MEVKRAPEPGAKSIESEDLPEAVENLFQIARLRILGRRLGLKKITGLKTGFKLHREGILKDLGRKAQQLIKSNQPEIYADDPNALEFAWKDWQQRRKLVEAATVVQFLEKDK